MTATEDAGKYVPREPTAEQWAARRERFWQRCIKQPGANGCWTWAGALTDKGYGRMVIGGVEYIAHRLAMMDAGIEIPAGMFADHICRRRDCIRPDHLRAVSPRVNSIENSVGPTAQNAAKTHCYKGHAFTPENTRIKIRDGIAHRDCRTCRREWKRANTGAK